MNFCISFFLKKNVNEFVSSKKERKKKEKNPSRVGHLSEINSKW